MKKFLLSAVCLLAAALCASAQSINALEDGKYSISVGETTMTVDVAHGAKILSYKIGDDEVLNQGRMPNSFGSTFWTSPQKEWNWPPVPEYDSLPYTAEVKDGPVKVADLASGEPLPKELLHALLNPAVEKWAFNAAFESNLSHVRERFTCYTAFWLLNAGIVRAAGASGTDTPKRPVCRFRKSSGGAYGLIRWTSDGRKVNRQAGG